MADEEKKKTGENQGAEEAKKEEEKKKEEADDTSLPPPLTLPSLLFGFTQLADNNKDVSVLDRITIFVVLADDAPWNEAVAQELVKTRNRVNDWIVGWRVSPLIEYYVCTSNSLSQHSSFQETRASPVHIPGKIDPSVTRAMSGVLLSSEADKKSALIQEFESLWGPRHEKDPYPLMEDRYTASHRLAKGLFHYSVMMWSKWWLLNEKIPAGEWADYVRFPVMQQEWQRRCHARASPMWTTPGWFCRPQWAAWVQNHIQLSWPGGIWGFFHYAPHFTIDPQEQISVARDMFDERVAGRNVTVPCPPSEPYTWEQWTAWLGSVIQPKSLQKVPLPDWNYHNEFKIQTVGVLPRHLVNRISYILRHSMARGSRSCLPWSFLEEKQRNTMEKGWRTPTTKDEPYQVLILQGLSLMEKYGTDPIWSNFLQQIADLNPKQRPFLVLSTSQPEAVFDLTTRQLCANLRTEIQEAYPALSPRYVSQYAIQEKTPRGDPLWWQYERTALDLGLLEVLWDRAIPVWYDQLYSLAFPPPTTGGVDLCLTYALHVTDPAMSQDWSRQAQSDYLKFLIRYEILQRMIYLQRELTNSQHVPWRKVEILEREGHENWDDKKQPPSGDEKLSPKVRFHLDFFADQCAMMQYVHRKDQLDINHTWSHWAGRTCVLLEALGDEKGTVSKDYHHTLRIWTEQHPRFRERIYLPAVMMMEQLTPYSYPITEMDNLSLAQPPTAERNRHLLQSLIQHIMRAVDTLPLSAQEPDFAPVQIPTDGTIAWWSLLDDDQAEPLPPWAQDLLHPAEGEEEEEEEKKKKKKKKKKRSQKTLLLPEQLRAQLKSPDFALPTALRSIDEVFNWRAWTGASHRILWWQRDVTELRPWLRAHYTKHHTIDDQTLIYIYARTDASTHSEIQELIHLRRMFPTLTFSTFQNQGWDFASQVVRYIPEDPALTILETSVDPERLNRFQALNGKSLLATQLELLSQQTNMAPFRIAAVPLFVYVDNNVPGEEVCLHYWRLRLGLLPYLTRRDANHVTEIQIHMIQHLSTFIPPELGPQRLRLCLLPSKRAQGGSSTSKAGLFTGGQPLPRPEDWWHFVNPPRHESINLGSKVIQPQGPPSIRWPPRSLLDEATTTYKSVARIVCTYIQLFSDPRASAISDVQEYVQSCSHFPIQTHRLWVGNRYEIQHMLAVTSMECAGYFGADPTAATAPLKLSVTEQAQLAAAGIQGVSKTKVQRNNLPRSFTRIHQMITRQWMAQIAGCAAPWKTLAAMVVQHSSGAASAFYQREFLPHAARFLWRQELGVETEVWKDKDPIPIDSSNELKLGPSDIICWCEVGKIKEVQAATRTAEEMARRNLLLRGLNVPQATSIAELRTLRLDRVVNDALLSQLDRITEICADQVRPEQENWRITAISAEDSYEGRFTTVSESSQAEWTPQSGRLYVLGDSAEERIITETLVPNHEVIWDAQYKYLDPLYQTVVMLPLLLWSDPDLAEELAPIWQTMFAALPKRKRMSSDGEIEDTKLSMTVYFLVPYQNDAERILCDAFIQKQHAWLDPVSPFLFTGEWVLPVEVTASLGALNQALGQQVMA